MVLDAEQAASWLEAMAEQQTAREHCEYIAPAGAREVMAEQLDFLVAHGEDCRRRGCADCRRLADVASLLLRPFEPPL